MIRITILITCANRLRDANADLVLSDRNAPH
jgi:hypothetical protein